MKAITFLLFLATIVAVVLGHLGPNDQSHPLPSRTRGHHTESEHHGAHTGYRSIDSVRAPTLLDKHLTPVQSSGTSDQQPATRLPSHPHGRPHSFMPTSQTLSSTTAPFITHAVASHFERGGCPPGITACPGSGVICCPFDSYCTADEFGNEGCCLNGVHCSGLATSIRGSYLTVSATPVHGAATASNVRGSFLTISATPVHGAAVAQHPLKLFAVFAHILRLVTAMPAIERKAEDQSHDGPKIVFKALPPDTCGAPFCSASSGMLRPLRIFSVPVWFARRLAAAVLPIEERGSETLPPDTCGAPFCSAATRSHPHLMRVITIPVLFAKGLVALALPADKQQDSSEALPPDTCGAPFCSAASRSQPRLIKIFTMPVLYAKGLVALALPADKQRDSPEALPPDTCGAPFCSAATRSAANPLKFPVWFVAKASGFLSMTAVGSPVTPDAGSSLTSKASETSSEEHDCEDTVPSDDKNAREGLGVGSALVDTWSKAREKTAMVVGGFRQHMRGMRAEVLGWY